MALNAASQKRLALAHPLLRKLIAAVVADGVPLIVLDSQRGRKAQEQAFSKGNSRAHFGQSAHNWSPAIALDVVPSPLDWNDIAAFKRLGATITAKAKVLGIPISWGGTWKSLKDFPHYELAPWRDFAAKAKPFEG